MSQLSLEDFLNSAPVEEKKPETPVPKTAPMAELTVTKDMSKDASKDLVKESQEKITEKITETKSEPQILSVGDLNRMIRGTLEGQFGTVWLRGEISNFKPHTSGHFYFSLKDSTAQISAVMFRGLNQKLKFKPDNGMEVVVKGKITVYEPRGNYQIFCEIMEPVGLGALQMAFEQLKAKLKAEGLFEVSRKKALPFMPKRIAIVTSPTGAAIRDMLNILSRRARGIEITVIPAVVQGAQAPVDIVRGIELAQKVGGFDVLIVGRGGGSMEDLWGFNDEAVARAIAHCQIPTISAVGHEIDFTIADFVADLRAPTPSAAAELVVRNTSDLQEKLKMLLSQLTQATAKKIQFEKKHLSSLERGLVDPKRRLQDLAIRCDELLQRLELSMKHVLDEKQQLIVLLRQKLGDPQQKLNTIKQQLQYLYSQLTSQTHNNVEHERQRLARASDLLDSLSPLKVVSRGYSIVTENKKLIKSASQLKKGASVNIQFANGSAEALIQNTKP